MTAIKSKSKKELAAEYGVCMETFRKWTKKIHGLNTGSRNILTPAEVQRIYSHLGMP